MTTSGTYNFSMDIDEVIQEASEMIGGEQTLGNEPKSARRSINLLLQDWQNRGVLLWTANTTEVTVSASVTSPDDTPKSFESKDAIPLFEVVASSPAKVIVPEDSVTSIPSPAVNVIVPPKAVAVEFDPSVTVIEELVKALFAILLKVLFEALIVLLVNVSEPANVAKDPSDKAVLN